ncbi:DUF962-domain-containing protein [Dentipellis sp. KUC8613]|nr:DUF962-domain-containing protein [Dentipellis sp. KUC8613]
MAFSDLFNVRKQLTFYGAYHSNPVNVGIHIVCVPILLWTFQVMMTAIPPPTFLPAIHYTINDYMTFELNVAAIHAGAYLLYYSALDPRAALLYTPQMVLSLLTSTSFSKQEGHFTTAAIINGISWILQFIGHGAAEKRAPALLDNIVGALVLAPFFVHLEILFSLGYRPTLHKQLINDVGVEITRIKKIQGAKARAEKAKGN